MLHLTLWQVELQDGVIEGGKQHLKMVIQPPTIIMILPKKNYEMLLEGCVWRANNLDSLFFVFQNALSLFLLCFFPPLKAFSITLRARSINQMHTFSRDSKCCDFRTDPNVPRFMTKWWQLAILKPSPPPSSDRIGLSNCKQPGTTCCMGHTHTSHLPATTPYHAGTPLLQCAAPLHNSMYGGHPALRFFMLCCTAPWGRGKKQKLEEGDGAWKPYLLLQPEWRGKQWAGESLEWATN